MLLLENIFSKKFFYTFLIIFLLKCSYLLIFGQTVEIDSYGYAECTLHFEYPPTYPYFLYFLRSVYASLFFVAIVQVFLFSVCASLFTNYFFAGKKSLLAAILLGIEPVTSLFCSNIMSECMFISVLMLWIILVYDFFAESKKSFLKVFLIGVLAGILYSVRFAGILFLFFFIVMILANKEKRKYFLSSIVILFISFHLIILPVRIKYKMVFDTYFFNGFTGELLWNNASAIYLQSGVRKNPETDFEKFVAQTDTANFTIEKAITGRQLWEPDLAYRSYMLEKQYGFNDLPKASTEAGNTALKIIRESPFSYFKMYVLPSFFQAFLTAPKMEMQKYAAYFSETYHTASLRTPFYSAFYWIFYFSLLSICTLLYIIKKMKNIFCKTIFQLSWLYIIILPFISIPESRHYLILAPLILFAAILQLQSFYKAKLND